MSRNMVSNQWPLNFRETFHQSQPAHLAFGHDLSVQKGLAVAEKYHKSLSIGNMANAN